MEHVGVRFDHGLGDCVYFSHQLPLYARRGWNVTVFCNRDKEILFHAAGAAVSAGYGDAPSVPWFEGDQPGEDLRHDNYWRWSKMARNLSLRPMPDIGNPVRLWREYCNIELNAWPVLPGNSKDAVGAYVAGLQRPLILLHTHGSTDRERKNLTGPAVRDICRHLLASTDATILLLDWDGYVSPLPHWRVRHASYDFGRLGTAELLALIHMADLVVGIDSGPLHACRFTNTPAIGIWMRNGSPATWSLPRPMQVNVVVGRDHGGGRKRIRVLFNILECNDPASLPALIATTAARMLVGPRYLPRQYLGRDLLLQQFVRDWQGGRDNSLGGFKDRDRGFDWLFRAAQYFERPLIVETGCIRAEEDFSAGYSTLLFALFAASTGGELVTIDHNPDHCALARRTVASLGNAVDIEEEDSIDWLSRNKRAIDVLYLDSQDTDQPDYAEHGLFEIQAAYDTLHDRSIVAWDDTSYDNGDFVGKGALGVPWLIAQGWKIVFSGHQTMLTRSLE